MWMDRKISVIMTKQLAKLFHHKVWKKALRSIRTEGENGDNSVDIDEDTDKQDDDISESDYSYVTVADLSKKEDISQSDIEDPSKLQKEKEANIKEDNKEEKKEEQKEE